MHEPTWQLNRTAPGFTIVPGTVTRRNDLLQYDTIIVGAGIVGAAACRELLRRRPGSRVLIIDKEKSPGRHQTGHNSGVVHAGVYYEPGSLKARFCRRGVSATAEFCREHSLPFERTGKLLVATNDAELSRLQALFERCQQNGLRPEMLDIGTMLEIEPRITGTGGFLVRETAITDYPAICRSLLDEAGQRGAEVRLGEEVIALSESADGVEVTSTARGYSARTLLVCGGLAADRLAQMQGLDISFRIIPYRGEYYRLHPRLHGLIKRLVYPVPDPTLPFLGVHLTLMTDGSITVGPNAVQGWKREGYGKFNFSLKDSSNMLAFPGFWKASMRHLAAGAREYRDSLWKRGYLKRVQKYCPEILLNDLLPHPSGIRAQAVLSDGTMVHDFLLESTSRSLHVCNAPSPAATSAIPIAEHICAILLEKL